MKKLLLLLFLFTLTILQAEQWQRSSPGGFQADGSLAKEKITLTETVDITLALTIPQGYSVSPQALVHRLVDDGEIPDRSFKLLSHQEQTKGLITTFIFTLSPLSPGHHILTFRDITFKPNDRKKEAVTLLSGVFAIDVAVPDDTAVLPTAGVLPLVNRPILDLDVQNQQELAKEAQLASENNRNALLQRNFPWHYLLIYPLALVMIYGACHLVITVFKALWKPRPAPSPTEVIDAQLKELEQSDLMATNNFDAFYVRLIQSLRVYIEGYYHVALTDMTTEEFIQRMTEEAPFDQATRHQLSELLAYADQVKFAKQPANAESCVTALNHARQFVRMRG